MSQYAVALFGIAVIAEALEVTPRLAAALTRGATIMDLRAIAVSEGMTTLACDGIRRAAQGKTSLAEGDENSQPHLQCGTGCLSLSLPARVFASGNSLVRFGAFADVLKAKQEKAGLRLNASATKADQMRAGGHMP